MAYQLNCGDGVTLRGATIEDVLDQAEAHIRNDHPELHGKVGRNDLRPQIVEV